MPILTLSLKDGGTASVNTRHVVAIYNGADGGAIVKTTSRDIGTTASLHVMEAPKTIMAMIEQLK